MREVVTIARVVLAIAFLHISLAIFYWLPEPGAATLLTPTLDLLALIAALALWGALWDGSIASSRLGRLVAARLRRRADAGRNRPSCPGTPPRGADRALRVALTATLSIFLALGFAQGFARREFGYDLVLPLHIPYIPELFKMMYDHEPLPMFVVYCALLGLAVALAIAGLHVAVSSVAVALRGRRGRRLLVGIMAGYALLAGLTVGVKPPLAREALAQLRFAMNLEARLADTARGMEVESQRDRPPNPFVRMSTPPSIFNFVIESYGAVVFQDGDIRARAEPALASQLEELEAAGYGVRTGYLDAPVFGGSSWMAQQTILCGVWVDSQERFESLFGTRVRCLPELLNEAGYRTVIAAGNTTFLEDRYERKFPFDAYYFRDDFGYQGYRYGWSFVPDQFAIQFVERHEQILQGRDAPIFVHYQLTTSHHPWSDVPPIIEDWDSIDDGSVVFAEPGARFSNQFVRGSHYSRGYWETVNYSMRVITDYVSRLPDEDALIFILGDHQPRNPVADMHGDPWWVPVHILSRDQAALDRFAAMGFIEGILPPELDPADEAQAPAGLDHFIRNLFRAFGTHHAGDTREP
jgi:hypothetical protein